MTTLAHLGPLTPGADYTREYIRLKRWALQTYGTHGPRAFNNQELPRIGRRDAIIIAARWADVARGIPDSTPIGDDIGRAITRMNVAAYGSAQAAQQKRPPTGAALDGELTATEAASFWHAMSQAAIALPSAELRTSLLAHLGQLTPGRRNAQPGSKDYDYVREYIKLKRWAAQKYGVHERKAMNGTSLPRLPRREALQIAAWWKDVAQGIQGGNQTGNEVIDGVQKMQAAAYGSADAARKQRTPTGSALDEELAPEEAAFFWAGMSRVSISIGAAKSRPTLFDKGVLVFESLFDSAAELPERLIDATTWVPRTIIETGQKIGDDVQAGIGKLIQAAKWTGIIGGGLLATYVVTRFVPKREPRALPPGPEESEP